MTPRTVRRLTLALALVYAAMGTLEVVSKLVEKTTPATIVFFGATLLGGAALILAGLYSQASDPVRQVLVILGSLIGLAASAWTIVVPLLAIAVIVMNVRAAVEDKQTPPAS